MLCHVIPARMRTQSDYRSVHGEISAFMLISSSLPSWSVCLKAKLTTCLQSQVLNQELPLELKEDTEPRVPWGRSYRNLSPLGGYQYNSGGIPCHDSKLKDLLYVGWHRSQGVRSLFIDLLRLWRRQLVGVLCFSGG